MWNHFRSIWLMLTGLQISTEIAPYIISSPPAYVWVIFFSVNLVGVAKGNLEMEQPSVWDTIPELYEMSPKINYFDLAFTASCFFQRKYYMHRQMSVGIQEDFYSVCRVCELWLYLMVSCKVKCKMSDCLSAICICVLVNVQETYGYSVGNFQNPNVRNERSKWKLFLSKIGTILTTWGISVYSPAEFAVYF